MDLKEDDAFLASNGVLGNSYPYMNVDVSRVATDSGNRVYILTRAAPWMEIRDHDGKLLSSFGTGLFTDRTHGISIDKHDSVYRVDDANHIVRKFTRSGELLMTLGTCGVPSDTDRFKGDAGTAPPEYRIFRSGAPFNRPTNIAIGDDGDLFVSDGYANARIHHFQPRSENPSSHGWRR